ncbi:3-oxoacid CoA-transferase subunit B [Bordetella sp. BOR01]|uniref:3-oxoacid CoA-transferase subunit B n=1 Tax=Bordetella sp. BOR01 TaxID=2854779 RepID=UPI001C490962|nr:3-oxoacid CoA-transferase subunit B [Bordetella sp. BOR01]MBV7481835.1 3-oxoacid CoA-transferase subunit B [Bordetella sp. BOR01]
MTDPLSLNRQQIAQLVARDIPEGATVNLGIGMPTLVSDHLPTDREILLHSENGILGMGPAAEGGAIDPDLINASRVAVTLLPGASITEHTISFAMMRGGHLDFSILGGFQVAANGDLANWITDAPDAIPAIGGAMDLAVGARKVLVMMEHTTKAGEPKLLETCTYPLTAAGVVDTVYTNWAIVDIKDHRFVLRSMVAGMDIDTLQRNTGARLSIDGSVQTIRLDTAGRACTQP